MFAQKLGAELGQPVVVQSRPGASSTIGASLVQRAAPDGYTLLIGDGGTFSVVNQLRKNKVFDSLQDFTPVAPLVKTPYFVLTNAESPARSLNDVIAQARGKPGAVAYGNVGVGSVAHLAVEEFSRQAGIKLLAVPYKGSGEVISALIGNTVQLSFSGGALNQVNNGRVKALAVASAERLKAAPDLPTIKESTGIDSVAEAWWGIVAPRGTPQAVVQTLNQAINKVSNDPELQSQFASWGFVFTPGTPDQLRQRIVADTGRWQAVIAAANLQAVD
ncbi:tripartite tricarboxylate transporter substrate binding protein [Achromobacter marplatensis]|uniref:tripartite tricarboxylate transporter substrate binding protein n=1 Tax=Achromobacter marplatensis TaxID=470868 RepID=UPI0028E4FFD8|nr:tripartite tricarboxylate transporter substrate binding protein [Achromobacter marplatensis]